MHVLFNSLITPLFGFGLQVRGVAGYTKYLSNIDKLQAGDMKFGGVKYVVPILDLLEQSDWKLWKMICTNPASNPLYEPVPNKRGRSLRPRGQNFILPQIKTERFKNLFLHMRLFR